MFLSKGQGEIELKDLQSCKLWSPIINHAVGVMDRWERSMGTGKCSRSRALLVDDMEVVQPKKYKVTAALDVQWGWIASAFQLEDCDTEVVGLSKSGS